MANVPMEQVLAEEEDEPILCGERFAFELWKVILGHLYFANNDQLWNCRSVCKDLKILADEVLKEKTTLWTTNVGISWDDFVKRVKGTRFSGIEDINRFILETGCDEYPGKNPFPNGTVILIRPAGATTPSAVNNTKPFYYSLAKLVSKFQDNIHNLVYSFGGESDLQDVTQLLRISKLKKLRSLVILNPNWNMLTMPSIMLIQELRDNIVEGMETTKILTELQIYGKCSYRPLFLIFPVFKNVTKSLRKVRIICHENDQQEYENLHDISNRIYGKFEYSLTNLKVINPYDCLLRQQDSGIDASSLKELSVRFIRSHVNDDGNNLLLGQRISQLFGTLDASGASLSMEQMYLEIDDDIIKSLNETSRLLDPPLDDKGKYEKVKHFVVKASTILRWQELPVELLKKKFNNVKKVSLVMSASSDIGSNSTTPKEFYDKLVSEVWKRFPTSVEIIHVPFFGWKLRRDNLQCPNFQLEL